MIFTEASSTTGFDTTHRCIAPWPTQAWPQTSWPTAIKAGANHTPINQHWPLETKSAFTERRFRNRVLTMMCAFLMVSDDQGWLNMMHTTSDNWKFAVVIVGEPSTQAAQKTRRWWLTLVRHGQWWWQPQLWSTDTNRSRLHFSSQDSSIEIVPGDPSGGYPGS